MTEYKLNDYSSSREIINNVQFYYKSELKLLRDNALFIHVPDKIKKFMGLSKLNNYKFKVIILRTG